jgi:phage regulator Rha-like protein
MTTLDIIEPTRTPAIEPHVFERNGRVYANTRDLASFFGRNHRKIVRSIKQSIEEDPTTLETEIDEADAVEVVYCDSRGRPALSYNLSFGGFLFFMYVVVGHSGLTPYDRAFIDKEKAIEANAEQVEQVTVLKKCNDHLTQENAKLSYRVRQLEIALCKDLKEAVSLSLFRN